MTASPSGGGAAHGAGDIAAVEKREVDAGDLGRRTGGNIAPDDKLFRFVGPNRQYGFIHFPRLGQLAGVLVKDSGPQKGMNVLAVPLQRLLKMTLGGDVITLGQLGDTEFSQVIIAERASRPKGIPEQIILKKTAGAEAGGNQHHERNA